MSLRIKIVHTFKYVYNKENYQIYFFHLLQIKWYNWLIQMNRFVQLFTVALKACNISISQIPRANFASKSISKIWGCNLLLIPN